MGAAQFVPWFSIGVIALLGVCAGVFVAGVTALSAGWTMSCAISGAAVLYLAAVRVARCRLTRGLGGAVVLVVILVAATFPSILGALVPDTDSHQAAALLRDVDPAQERPVGSMLQADSMVFATRGRVEFIDGHVVDAWLRSHRDGLVVFPQDLRPTRLPADARTVKTTPNGFWIIVETHP